MSRKICNKMNSTPPREQQHPRPLPYPVHHLRIIGKALKDVANNAYLAQPAIFRRVDHEFGLLIQT